MRVLCIVAALVLVIAPSSALAQEPLPVGEAHGVRIVREQGAIVVIFTKRAAGLYRRIAGRLVDVHCTEQGPLEEERPRAYTFIGPLGPGAITEESSGGITMRAPERRRKLRTGDLTRGMDFCRVWRGRRPIVSVPLTQRGAVFLDEEAKTIGMMRWLFTAGFVGEELNLSGWPSHAHVVAKLGPEAGARLVDLANPTDTPPAHRVGYYSDRREHVAVAVLSKSGKRLFLEVAGDVLTTNVAGHVFNGRRR